MKAAIAVVVLLAAIGGGIFFTRMKMEKKKAQEASLLTKAGLTSGTIPCRGDDCTLNVVIGTKKVCHTGDFDVISSDLSRPDSDKSLILTVEPLLLDSPSFAPQSQPVTLSQLESGVTHAFPLSKAKHPTDFGIFLCTDPAKLGHCFGKKVVGYDLLIFDSLARPQREKEKSAPPPPPAKDRVYFFQYLYWTDQSLFSISDADEKAMTDEMFRKRKTYLATHSSSGQDDREASRRSFAMAKYLSRSLQSLPLEFVGNEAHVVLPRADPTCARQH